MLSGTRVCNKICGENLIWILILLGNRDITGLFAFGPFNNFKFHNITLIQGTIAITLYSRIMHKNVCAIILTDEAIAFLCTEPFDSPTYACHFAWLLSHWTIVCFTAARRRQIVKIFSC